MERSGTARTRFQAVAVLLVVAASLGLAALHGPRIMIDDAAISLRYAERMATGSGLTYNDHERVHGFSNPLHTLLIAAVSRVSGVGVEAACRGLAWLLYPLSLVLVMLLGSRLAGPWSGVLAAVTLLSNAFFRFQAFSGMESVLCVVLGLAAVTALAAQREVAAGVLLGLAVLGKLDMGLLALAIAGAWWITHRRLPWRTAWAALATVTPWWLFSWWYFGTVIPHSLRVKLLIHATGSHDKLWAVKALAEQGWSWLWLPALALLLSWRRLRPEQRLIAAAAGGWLALHLAAVSLVDLGDPYPWYLTVLFPLLGLLSGAGALIPHGDGTRRPRIISGALLACCALGVYPGFSRTLGAATSGSSDLHAFEAFESDRRLAGVFIDQYAGADEVVASWFGWIAFECRRPFNDLSLLNSRTMLPEPMYTVVHGQPYATGSNPPVPPPGTVAVATFDLASDVAPGYTWFTVFAHPDSVIARNGPRLGKLCLRDFPSPRPLSPVLAMENVQVRTDSIFAHPPSGMVFELDEVPGTPAWFRVQPAFTAEVPWSKTDGVTFEVRVNGESLFREHRTPADPGPPVVVPVPPEALELVLITEAGPQGDRDYDWAVWQAPKIVTGTAVLDVDRLGDEALQGAWCRHNPGTCKPVPPAVP